MKHTSRARPASLVAAALFSLVAVAHVLRLLLRTEVTIGGTVIPMWVSVPGFIVPAVLAVLLFREARRP